MKSRLEDLLPVDPIRDAVLESGVPLVLVARRVGWTVRKEGREYADSLQLKRALGLADCYGGSKKTARYRLKRIGYDHAVRIVRAIDADPVDFGL